MLLVDLERVWGQARFGAFPTGTREAEKMYIGGGVVGTVVIVLLVLFLMGRI